MSLLRCALVLTAVSVAAAAHPMGNFSVNHYSRLHFDQTGVSLTYVLDLAEIPTFQLFGSGERKADEQAREWVANLDVRQNGRKISWQVQSIAAKSSDGAGGMPVTRVVIEAQAGLQAGEVRYRDLNFPGRAGWKEIVIDHGEGAVVRNPSQGSADWSNALTVYPTDPSVTPPQNLEASAEWSPAATTSAVATSAARPATAADSFAAQQPTAVGTVVRGDFLSRMLQKRNLGWRLMLLCACAAFGLGAMHAMSPGHGKTIVAAYLVGSRGTLKHAGLLGFVVTFTHTFTVFLLGLGVIFFQQYVTPEKAVPVLGALSGMSIVAVGISLLYKRAHALLHEYGRHSHHHGVGSHTHTIEGEITPGGLIALGVGGGMVPCPSALILMLSAIALGRPALGLVLLVAFSSGLALVLMAIGGLALYARQLLPDGEKASRHPAFRLIPVFSSVVVIVLGLTITAVSAGWLRPMRFLS